MTNPVQQRIFDLIGDGLHPMSVLVSNQSGGGWKAQIDFDDGEGLERYPAEIIDLGPISYEVVETWIREIAVEGRAPGWSRFGGPKESIHEYYAGPVEWMREPVRSRLLEKYRTTHREAHKRIGTTPSIDIWAV